MHKNILPIFFFLLLPFVCSAQVDTSIGLSAPSNVCKDYKDLTHYLCDNLKGDKEKANAIYNWITHNIKYDVKAVEKGHIKTPDADKVLSNRRGVCGGYAVLFTQMCREAGLKSITIDGYAKDWMFDNGDKLYLPRHGWSAVLIDGKWELADPTWGAGGLVAANSWWRKILNKVMRNKVAYSKHMKFEFEYNPAYFMQDPEVFRLKHLPTDPLWQLTDSVMPIALFEAGDSAVKKFNDIYSNPKQNSPELMRVCDLDEDQRTYELAERAYQYNNRYPLAMAIMTTYGAASEVDKALTDSTVKNVDILMGDAKTILKKSQGYLKEQKKTIPEEYSTLKKNNQTKNQDAKQYIRQVKTDDKRLVAQSKKYNKSVTAKGGKIKKKYTQVSKRKHGLSPDKIQSIEPAKIQKKKDSPEILTLDDTLTARQGQIDDIKPILAAQKLKLEQRQDQNKQRLDSFAALLHVSDSLLVMETISRMKMHSSTNDEVLLLGNKYKEIKYSKVDTLQKYYLIYFDSIVNDYNALQKIQVQEMDICKKTLRTLEQYKKWSSYNATTDDLYKEWATTYIDCIDAFGSDIADYSGYLKRNKKLFLGLQKEGRTQIKVTEYMAKAEDLRSKMEKQEISRRQAFDNYENQRQTVVVKKLQDQVQEIAGKLN